MSKFAVLRIEDDSEEDSVENVVKAAGGAQKKKKRAHGKKKTTTVVDQDGFVLTTTDERRAKEASEPVMIVYGEGDKPKSAAKQFEQAKSAEDEDDKHFQEAMKRSVAEAKKQQQRAAEEEKMVQTAVNSSLKESKPAGKKERSKAKSVSEHESSSSAAPATAVGSARMSSAAEAADVDGAAGAPSADGTAANLLQAADVAAKQLLQERFDHQLQPSEMKITMVFRSKLKEAVKQVAALSGDRDSIAAEAKKYKERYKKLCELLKDAEVREKAQLLIEMERVTKVNEELTGDITSLTSEVEQQRSRIHELEKKLEHHKAHAGSPTA